MSRRPTPHAHYRHLTSVTLSLYGAKPNKHNQRAVTSHVKALYMATHQKRQRKSRLIAKKELAYLLSRLRTIDATITRASVLKWPSAMRRCHTLAFSSLRLLFTRRCGVTNCLSLSLSCSSYMAIVMNHACALCMRALR